jgi:hypothetical protein
MAFTNLTGAMTESQFSFLIKLIGQAYATDPTARAAELVSAAGLDKAGASLRIDALKALAKSAPTAPISAPTYLPSFGSYLVNGKVLTVKKPKWAGSPTWLTIDNALGGSFEKPKAFAAALLAQIDTADKAHAAVIAYAKATGKCGVCHKTLTDPASIAAGIGPVCAKKYGF